jgi:hypothetical protein
METKQDSKGVALWFALIVIGLVAVTLGTLSGYVNYNYNVDKCLALSSESFYGFSHTIEMNAGYSERCFYYTQHPLALFYTLLGAFIISVTITLCVLFIIGVIYFSLSENNTRMEGPYYYP